MEKKGSELIFISRIFRDGSGVTTDIKNELNNIQNDVFKCNWLSISQGTLIASEMNSYVVKLKNPL